MRSARYVHGERDFGRSSVRKRGDRIIPPVYRSRRARAIVWNARVSRSGISGRARYENRSRFVFVRVSPVVTGERKRIPERSVIFVHVRRNEGSGIFPMSQGRNRIGAAVFRIGRIRRTRTRIALHARFVRVRLASGEAAVDAFPVLLAVGTSVRGRKRNGSFRIRRDDIAV